MMSYKTLNVYEMQELQGVNWLFGNYERLAPFITAECRMSCLHDCSCAAAMVGSSGCWKKRLPLGDGRVENGHTKALIKARKVVPSPNCRSISTRKNDQGRKILLESLSISLAISLFFGNFCLIIFLKHNKGKKEASRVQF